MMEKCMNGTACSDTAADLAKVSEPAGTLNRGILVLGKPKIRSACVIQALVIAFLLTSGTG